MIERESREVVFFLVMCDQRDQALAVCAGVHASNIADNGGVALPPKVGSGSSVNASCREKHFHNP